MDPYPSTVTTDDLERIGRLVINATATALALGHAGTNGLMIYTDPGDDWRARFVHDFINFSTYDPDPAAVVRLAEFVTACGALDAIADAVTR